MVVYIKLTALRTFYIHLHVARAEIMLYNLFSFLRNDHQRNAQVSADGKYIIRVATIISTRLPREHGPSLLFSSRSADHACPAYVIFSTAGVP